MVKAKMVSRVERLRSAIGTGCPACFSFPMVHVIGIGDPEPELQCALCGRRFDGLLRVYVGVNGDSI